MKTRFAILATSSALFLGCSNSDNNDAAPDSGADLASVTDTGTTADAGETIDTGEADSSTPSADMNGRDGGSVDMGPTADLVAETLAAVNSMRALEQMCGNTTVGPVGELVLVAELTEAAQGHADDMAAMEQITFTGSDGSTSNDRVMATGWSGSFRTESLAAGEPVAALMVGQLMSGEGTCQNLMFAGADSLGVGYAEGGGTSPYWSIVLGASQ